MDIIVRFARAGLIHGDFNEFNILIRRDTWGACRHRFPSDGQHITCECRMVTIYSFCYRVLANLISQVF